MALNVTKVALPPIEEFEAYLRDIWEAGWVTNNGRLACLLEHEIPSTLRTSPVALVNNGTIALQVALRASGVDEGEVITTPFTHISTAAAIEWVGCKAVFADIDSRSLTLDPEKVEAKIGPRTRAILATHVFGIPADVDALKNIADRHQLKLIFDSSHAVGSVYRGRALVDYGLCSAASFHATKVFHTVEGGGIFSDDPAVIERVRRIRNFGLKGHYDFTELGTNAKISELHAAMGLCMLKRLPEEIQRRRDVAECYDANLDGLVKYFQKPRYPQELQHNYCYYPVLFQSEPKLLECLDALAKSHVLPRRYFRPSLNEVPFLDRSHLPISRSASDRILCLPLSSHMELHHVREISAIIRKTLQSQSIAKTISIQRPRKQRVIERD